MLWKLVRTNLEMILTDHIALIGVSKLLLSVDILIKHNILKNVLGAVYPLSVPVKHALALID